MQLTLATGPVAQSSHWLHDARGTCSRRRQVWNECTPYDIDLKHNCMYFIAACIVASVTRHTSKGTHQIRGTCVLMRGPCPLFIRPSSLNLLTLAGTDFLSACSRGYDLSSAAAINTWNSAHLQLIGGSTWRMVHGAHGHEKI
jgi:hypothetical protein